MRKINKIKTIIDKLVTFSPRQLENEILTANFIIDNFKKNQVKCYEQNFSLDFPRTKNVFLKADGKKILCKSCSLKSGEINSKNTIISSLLPSAVCNERANINFNPCCNVISLANFYFAPAIAVSCRELNKILIAKKIQGKVMVEKIRHRTSNILVGNKINPKNIIFTHYDSIEKGAIDNASGVAVTIFLIIENRSLLKNNLFVFSACEELSFDKPVYWGAGYRFFEKEYEYLLKKAKKIIVIDSVGGSETKIYNKLEVVKLGFPIKNLDKFSSKVRLVAGSLDDLMDVYHSDLDNGKKIKSKFLFEASSVLMREINQKS